MNTVGALLKTSRLKKNLTLDEVEKATKIRKKFLIAIEKDDYSLLPSLSYAKGFVRNYSDYLGLNSTNMMAFFRRQTRDAPKSSLLPPGIAEPLNENPLRLTPSRFLGIIVFFLCLIFLIYFGLQYQRIQTPPTLKVEAPKDSLVMAENRLEVIGKTDPDATVTVNGVGVLVRTDGKFFDQIELQSGENTITIVATTRFGKSSAVVKKVFLNP